jgi:subtilase family protein
MPNSATPVARRWSALRAGCHSLAAVLLSLVTTTASAQIGLPALPALPVPRPLSGVGADLQGATGFVDRTTHALIDARLDAARKLIRDNRATLEADPSGAPIVRAEVVAYSPNVPALQQAVDAGFEVLRRQTLEGLDAEIVVLRVPAALTTRRALQRLRAQDPNGNYDYNHIYMSSGTAGAGSPEQAPATSPAAAAELSEHFDLGLIDGGVNTAHPALQTVRITSAGCNGARAISAHGTAVASLLVGNTPHFRGARPKASLLAIDVYCGLATGGAVDVIANAFALLARHRVPIVNVSLVGPPNLLLEQVVRTVQARGILIVAAVGNDGPSAAPLYPAAYPGVIAVTAVDARARVLPEACRGPHVQFAAPGADLVAANASNGYAAVRGTSFAAPIVAGLLSTLLDESGRDPARAIQQLQLQAKDLGQPGRDPVYGFGFVGDTLLHNDQITPTAE